MHVTHISIASILISCSKHFYLDVESYYTGLKEVTIVVGSVNALCIQPYT